MGGRGGHYPFGLLNAEGLVPPGGPAANGAVRRADKLLPCLGGAWQHGRAAGRVAYWAAAAVSPQREVVVRCVLVHTRGGCGWPRNLQLISEGRQAATRGEGGMGGAGGMEAAGREGSRTRTSRE